MSQENRPKLMTESGIVINGAGTLSGMYVNNTASGTMMIYGSTTASAPVTGTITPAIGYHYLGDIQATQGVYVTLHPSTLNITFYTKENN